MLQTWPVAMGWMSLFTPPSGTLPGATPLSTVFKVTELILMQQCSSTTLCCPPCRLEALTTERMSWEDWKKKQKEEAAMIAAAQGDEDKLNRWGTQALQGCGTMPLSSAC